MTDFDNGNATSLEGKSQMFKCLIKGMIHLFLNNLNIILV
jgi:hypothetical protein